MKIKCVKSIKVDGQFAAPGDIINVDKKTAKQLIDAGLASKPDPKPAPEPTSESEQNNNDDGVSTPPPDGFVE